MTKTDYSSGADVPYCSLYLSSAQTITSGSHGIILFDTVISDEWDMYDEGTPTGEIYAPIDGSYLVHVHTRFNPNGTGYRKIDTTFLGVTVLQDDVETSPDASIGEYLSLTYWIGMAAGQRVNVRAFQNSGGDLDILAGQEDTAIQVVYMGQQQ